MVGVEVKNSPEYIVKVVTEGIAAFYEHNILSGPRVLYGLSKQIT